MADEHLPVGSRAREDVRIQVTPNLVWENHPCEDPLQASKRRWQTHLGLEPVQGDPNLTVADAPHTDTIKTALLFRMASVIAKPEEKAQARALFDQLYPSAK